MMITLRENEKLLRTVRRSRSVLLNAAVLPVLAFALVWVLKGPFQFSFFGYLWQAVAALAVLSALYVAVKALIWNRNALLITNQRVVHYAQEGLFSARMREALLGDITDVVVRKKGLSALFGDRGTLILTTVGKQRVSFPDVNAPDAIVELINKLRGAARTPGTDAQNPEL